MSTLDVIRQHVGSCREWLDGDEEHGPDRCGRPSEYVLWGKLMPAEGLGPRCYDHAAKWVGHAALAPYSDYALINLVSLATAINREQRLPVEQL